MTLTHRKYWLGLVTVVVILLGSLAVMRFKPFASTQISDAVDDGVVRSAIVDSLDSKDSSQMFSDEPVAEGLGEGGCREDSTTVDQEEPALLHGYQKQAAAERLEGSRDPQLLLAAAILHVGYSVERAERFQAAVAANPADPIALNLAFSECEHETYGDWCLVHDIENRLIAADSNNGYTWQVIADKRAARREFDYALEAIQRAATSADVNTYFSEKAATIERGLAAANIGDSAQRTIAALYLATGTHRVTIDLFIACEARSQDDERWRESCVAYGRKLEGAAKSVFDFLTGNELQQSVMKSVSDHEGLLEVEKRREMYEVAQSSISDKRFTAEFWLNEQNVARFMDAMVNQSAFAAKSYYKDEYKSWLSNRCVSEN